VVVNLAAAYALRVHVAPLPLLGTQRVDLPCRACAVWVSGCRSTLLGTTPLCRTACCWTITGHI